MGERVENLGGRGERFWETNFSPQTLRKRALLGALLEALWGKEGGI